MDEMNFVTQEKHSSLSLSIVEPGCALRV